MESVKSLNRKEVTQGSQPDNTVVYTLAHDIKSPINHVRGLLLLAKRVNKDPELEGFLEMALNANQGLSDKVNELLDMNIRQRAEQPLRLRSLVNETWDHVYRMGGVEDIDMIHLCQVEEEIKADKTRLKSILQNLLENAVKYRKRDDSDHTIVMRSFVSEGRVIIKVTDNGIGMNKDQLQNVFTASYQADRSSEGHGMGMYLARKNARNMGGELNVTSRPGEGTTFTLDLPCNLVKS